MSQMVTRVVVPYLAIHPAARFALNQWAPGWEPVYVGGSDHAYFDLLAQLWADGKSFVVVEHDIAISEGVVASFDACLEPWCLHGYGHPAFPDGLLTASLGCTRFSAALLGAELDMMVAVGEFSTGLPARHWCHLDLAVRETLRARGHAPCVHPPPVTHLRRTVSNGW